MDEGTVMAMDGLTQAVRWEMARLLKDAHGDRTRAMELALKGLLDDELVSKSELEILTQMLRVGDEAAGGKRDPQEAYIEVRRLQYKAMAAPRPSPAALGLASTMADSYVSIVDYGDGSSSVVFAKKAGRYEELGGLIGTAIGGKFGGTAGAYVGGKIGSAVGGAVDDCLSDDDSPS